MDRGQTHGRGSMKQLFWTEVLANENAHHLKSLDQQK